MAFLGEFFKSNGHKWSLQKTPKKQQANKPSPALPAEYDGSHVMHMIHYLLQLSILHCHTLDHWWVVWNLFLEKDISNPRIYWLWAIHLGFLGKCFFAQGILPNAERNKQITDHQGVTQSAIDLACKNVACYNFIWILQIIAINIDINALACFDIMVEPCTSLSYLSHGADPWHIQLPAQTQKLFKYFVKHQFGISSNYSFTLMNTLGMEPLKVVLTQLSNG